MKNIKTNTFLLDTVRLKVISGKSVLLFLLILFLCVGNGHSEDFKNEEMLQAYQKLQDKKYDEAIAEFNGIILAHPGDDAAYFYRGSALASKGKFDQAISDFTKAIEINPQNGHAYGNRGLAYQQSEGGLDMALADYNQAIALLPEHHLNYENRGRIYLAQGKYDEALSDFNKAIALQPDFSYNYTDRGDLFLIKEDYDKALSDFNKAMELQPDNPDAHRGLGSLYFAKGELDKVLPHYNKAIEIEPNFGKGYYLRAVYFYHIKDYKKSWEDAQKATSLEYVVPQKFTEILKKALALSEQTNA